MTYAVRLIGRRLGKLTQAQPVNSPSPPDAPQPVDHFEQVCHQYGPPRLPLFVHLLVPSERKKWQIEFWYHYATKGVMIHRIFEKHLDFIEPAKAAELATLLRQLLKETYGR